MNYEDCCRGALFLISSLFRSVAGPTSPQRHDVLQAQVLGLAQVACNLVFCLVAAGQMEDALQATVVDCCAGNHHGRGLLVRARVPGRVPRDVDEQRPSRTHPVKSTEQRHHHISLINLLCCHAVQEELVISFSPHLEMRLTAPLAVRGGKNSSENQ